VHKTGKVGQPEDPPARASGAPDGERTMAGVATLRPRRARAWLLATRTNVAVLVAGLTAATATTVALVALHAMVSTARSTPAGSTSVPTRVLAAMAREQHAATRDALIILVVGGLVAVLAGWWARQAARADLAALTAVAEGLAAGDLTRTCDVANGGEVGRLGAALDQAAANLRQDFAAVASNADALAWASVELSAAASRFAGSADTANTQAAASADAAGAVSGHVAAIAAGGAQMGNSIRQIAVSTADATQVAARAVAVAASTTATVTRLGESSARIGEVVQVITSVAQQTNLLALNATIEAARAGAAGNGFAVVAREVKNLARETAQATDDNTRRVGAIQDDTAAAVAAISEIASIIARIDQAQTSIASALEEQTATTTEMSLRIADAATGTREIAERITAVADVTHQTAATTDDARRAATELAQMSGQLQQIVARLRY
jgi:methyl-accepting chemotaxis protein